MDNQALANRVAVGFLAGCAGVQALQQALKDAPGVTEQLGWANIADGPWNYVPLALLIVAFLSLLAGRWAPKKSAPVPEPLVPLEPPKRKRSPRTPDLSLANAVEIIKHSGWARIHGATRADVIQELRDKLAMGSLEAWGEPVNAGRLQWDFPAAVWAVWDLDPDTNTATHNGEPVLTRVQFASDYVRALWTA